MDIQIREIHDPDEFPAVVDLEAAIWGDPDDTIRVGTMMALVHEGALLAGAYDGKKLIGFVFGFPTQYRHRLHSHMAGVLDEYRGTPTALRLKYFQRDWCLHRGYDQVVWTFDPMRGLNANFNLRKLGGFFNEYIPNCYGNMTGINAGAPSDRAYLIWDLRAKQVYERIYATAPWPNLQGVRQINTLNHQVPAGVDFIEDKKVLMQIPEDWGHILQTDTSVANLWRMHSRQVFEHYFSKGYAVTDFVRNPNRYVLECLQQGEND